MKNKNICIFNFSRLLVIVCIFLTVSCKEEAWDDHYDQQDSRLEKSILTVLSENPEYSTFVTYLEQTGYSSQLQTSQAFTVWAPTNAAFAEVSSTILNNPDLLKELIGNHVSSFSYNTSSNPDVLVKMFNNKYVQFINANGTSTFGGLNLKDKDMLTANGVLHTINEVLLVSPNIWGYLNNNASEFPSLMEFLTQYNETIFDEQNSVKTGTNSLGQSVYDSIFIPSNTFFKTIGDLSSEERRYTFIGLTEPAYTGIYDTFKDFYNYPVADSIKANTDRTIFSNLNFLGTAEEINDLSGTPIYTTTGGLVTLDPSSITENVALSNGNVFVVNQLNYDPKSLIYKNIRYEIENAERRTIGDIVALTIQKKFSTSSSGLFYNTVSLDQNPNAGSTNNYFEIAFTNVLSASYTLHLKFVPVGASKKTKLRFEFSYTDANKNKVVKQIPAIEVGNQEDGVIQIGDVFDIPVYINKEVNNNYSVKLKVFVDVSEPELILYDRRFGIDYAELKPVE
ncbi:putative surface protein with fasciclin (FAS1) repeats [Mariniflexile fucanivorans]|uniref:Putative surface protein with fasciclin (FAS1) repeats n=1 Tax=Mariniflexile fucanivorans TaxID=264023 RepID=A0A4R1RJE8_9FLAO|nr:fasciclin domain-containing protein [Mariniflexile fucanivorans]TCL66271.1 putative surface protein with fasciclin (FAS1) repeats [Mariniflexile fucanivorans]